MRRSTGTILATLTLLGWVLAAGSSAHANPTYGLAEQFSEPRAVERAFGVTVDPVDGDVYVSNLFRNVAEPAGGYLIDKFTAGGSVVAPPSPFGQVKHASETLGYVMVSGLAVDPVNEDVYAIDGFGEAIQTYSGSTGSLLSSFSVAGSGNHVFFGGIPYTAVQIASNAAGDIFFPNAPNNEVQVFSPAGTLLGTITGSGASALKEPTGVAVGPEGDVYVADAGNVRIEEFSAAGTLLGSIASPGVQALAIGGSGEVFAGVLNEEDHCEPLSLPCFHVVVYGAGGVKVADFGAGAIGGAPLGAIDTLAVGPSGLVYVAGSGVSVFARQSAPTVLSAASSGVSQSVETVSARLDSGDADTTYHFEYGPSTAYGASVPVPDGNIGPGLEGPVRVGEEVTGLRPETTYHYRVVASNAFGTTAGPDQTFTTLPARAPTAATGQPVGVGANVATLSGTVETVGFETTYEFDFGVDTSYGTRIFGDAGSETGVQTFVVPLQGLQPGTTYHYRIVASNVFGTSYGVDETFTTATYPSSVLSVPVAPSMLPALQLTPTAAAAGGGRASAATATRIASDARAGGRGRRPRRKRKHRDGAAGHAHTARGRKGGGR